MTADNIYPAELPKFDMLTVKFQGDEDAIVLPYCEVANGKISSIEKDENKITLSVDGENVSVNLKDFTRMLQDTFDIKDIIELRVQLAGSETIVNIL